MNRQKLFNDVNSQISKIGQCSQYSKSKLNIDDLIYKYKMKKSNKQLANQYQEIIKLFDGKQQSKQISRKEQPHYNQTNNYAKEKEQLKIDIQSIINSTSPIKVTPRIHYQSFKTEIGNSLTSNTKYLSSNIQKNFISASIQYESDEEIKQITTESVSKLSKFSHSDTVYQGFNILNNILIKTNAKYRKESFILIKLFSKWTQKEKGINQLMLIIENKLLQTYRILDLQIISKSNSTNSIISLNPLSSIDENIPKFLQPIQLKQSNHFSAMNFEEYLRQQNQQ